MKIKRVTLSMLLSLALMVSFMPAAAFADEAPEADQFEVKTQAEGGVAVSGLDPDELLMQYIDENVKEEAASDGTMKAMAVNSLRRNKLNETEKKLYDALAPQIKNVANGKRESTVFEVPVSDALDKAAYTKKELRVKSVLMQEDGETVIAPEAYTAFKNAVNGQLNVTMGRVLRALIFDMPYELYWLDNENAVFDYVWDANDVTGYEDQICFDDPTNGNIPSIDIYFCVSMDYSAEATADRRGAANTTTVNQALTKSAAATAANISGIINAAKSDKTDAQKLIRYRDEICALTDYHPTAMEEPDFPYGDPWQLIYVFDGDDSTQVVCEGYSKAFKYLCDNTSFADSDVECFLVSGTLTQKGGGGVTGAHMWNIVHMDDGMNYIADITNCDVDLNKGDTKYVFLSDALSGSVKSGYTFKFADGTLNYVYDGTTRDMYSDSDLTLAFNAYPGDSADSRDTEKVNPMKASGKTVTLKAKTLKKKKQTIAASKAIKLTKPAGDVSYKLISVSKKSAKKKFSVAKNGKITVKKGLKKGTYKLTVAVRVTGDSNYPAASKNVKVTIKVR